MTKSLDMQHGALHGEVDRSLALFAPALTVQEPCDLDPEFSALVSMVIPIPIHRGAIHNVQRIIHHGIGLLLSLEVLHSSRAIRIGMEQHGQEVTTWWSAIWLAETTGNIGDGFPGGQAFEDAGPAALVVNLAFDEPLNGLCGH